MKLIYWEPAGQHGRMESNPQILDIRPVSFTTMIGLDTAGGTDLVLEGGEATELLGVDPTTAAFAENERYLVRKDSETHQLFIASKGRRYSVSGEQLSGYLATKQIQARVL